jgi:hypothetical protein
MKIMTLKVKAIALRDVEDRLRFNQNFNEGNGNMQVKCNAKGKYSIELEIKDEK